LGKPAVVRELEKLLQKIWTRSADHHTGQRLLERPRGKGLREERTRSPNIRLESFLHRGRQPEKNDAADAEAIVEAALRPSMRFVIPKTENQQACSMLFRTRDLFVRQRTQLINALRAHLAEHGVVAPQGIASLSMLSEIIEGNHGLELIVVETARGNLEQIEVLSSRIASLEKALRSQAKRSESTARLMSMPGMGPITAMAIEAFAPTMTTFRKGRDFAAWLGLVPKQHSTGGKQVLGRTSKMGQRDIRRLLIIGAMTVIRWACRKAPPENSWLARMLARKPRMLVAIALANKMARSIWAMTTKNENYRDSGLVAA
jgi:transposase